MSVQFGKCNFDGKRVDLQDLAGVRPMLAPYGPDQEGYIRKDNFGILYRAFHTTTESRREAQPYVSALGLVITWDGRLDNCEELIGQMTGEVSCESTDLEIVAAAYQRWGAQCFAKFIGDWALSVWNPDDQSLVLAKDFLGTRHLYYTIDKDHVTWCTLLDPLVLFAHHQFRLEEEYVAGWLSFFPATHLTPYVGIDAVPPSSFVRLSGGTQRTIRYWDFDPDKRVRYRTYAEYEEHFRNTFSESVRRHLRSDSTILAQLSGGMDSSSIVCVADDLIAKGQAEAPGLETVSYYDSSEPNWDESPYFMEIERKRGREGHHISVRSDEGLRFDRDNDRLPMTPSSFSNSVAVRLREPIVSRDYRVMLSGTGGDEVTGGVPTPMPELTDLLAVGELRLLARQLWIHFFGALPSFQENLKTLDALRRQLSCSAINPICEERYPYLDRTLLEFLFSIPREQLVRPGQRRSLIRRALRQLVPPSVLERRRKAYVSRGPMLTLGSMSTDSSTTVPFADALGFLDSEKFARALRQAHSGEEVPVVTLIRTLLLEFWIGQVARHGILTDLQHRFIGFERHETQFLKNLQSTSSSAS